MAYIFVSMQTIRIQTSQNIDIDYEVASLGDRVLGRLVDIGVFIGLAIVLAIMAALTKWDTFFGIALIIVFVVAFVFSVVGFEYFVAGSVEKRRVVEGC